MTRSTLTVYIGGGNVAAQPDDFPEYLRRVADRLEAGELDARPMNIRDWNGNTIGYAVLETEATDAD